MIIFSQSIHHWLKHIQTELSYDDKKTSYLTWVFVPKAWQCNIDLPSNTVDKERCSMQAVDTEFRKISTMYSTQQHLIYSFIIPNVDLPSMVNTQWCVPHFLRNVFCIDPETILHSIILVLSICTICSRIFSAVFTVTGTLLLRSLGKLVWKWVRNEGSSQISRINFWTSVTTAWNDRACTWIHIFVDGN